MPDLPSVSRRAFIAATATTASVAWTAKSYARVRGANDRLRIGFIDQFTQLAAVVLAQLPAADEVCQQRRDGAAAQFLGHVL